MKFARQLAAVLVVLAAVVALGIGWEHSSAAAWVVPYGGPQRAPGQLVLHGHVVTIRQFGPQGYAPFGWSRLGNLARTAEIEAAILTAVVVLDILWRRRRRARRRGSASRAATDLGNTA